MKKEEEIMTQIETYEKYLLADRMAAKSRQVAEWLVESLEHQDRRGNLKTIDQVNLKMGQELIAALDAYLNNEMEYLGKKNEKSA
jgi:hypothetical protein